MMSGEKLIDLLVGTQMAERDFTVLLGVVQDILSENDRLTADIDRHMKIANDCVRENDALKDALLYMEQSLCAHCQYEANVAREALEAAGVVIEREGE